MDDKSYFYVFVADQLVQLDEDVKEAFEHFKDIYATESTVNIYKPADGGFRPGVRGFKIAKVPGFAVADEDYNPESAQFMPNPYISVSRTFLEGRSKEDLFNLARDWHERIVADQVLHIGRDKILDQARRLFGKIWEEVKEVVQVVSPLVPKS